MSNQNIKSDLLVELSAEEGELLSGGGRKGQTSQIVCYEWEELDWDVDRGYSHHGRKSRRR
jgi:hypothetical protein